MRENVLDVLVYLFENYYLDEDAPPEPDRDRLAAHLREAGFAQPQIERAFDWLADLAELRADGAPDGQTPRAMRVFSPAECARLDADARGFLLFLEEAGVLTPATRELVVDRVMVLDEPMPVGLEQLKWVVLMVLYNQPGHEAAYAWVEDLVLDGLEGRLH